MKYSIDYINGKLKELETKDKFDLSSALSDVFLMLLSNQFDPVDIQIPDWLSAFYEVSTWQGSSLRSGVWTYYETRPLIVMEKVKTYLFQNAPDDMDKMYAQGIHNYQDENSEKQIDVWIEESEIIDKWISNNEILIYEWLKVIILKHQEFIFDGLT